MTTKTVLVCVEAQLKKGVAKREFLSYVEDAVTTWCGSLRPPGAYSEADPGDPLFDLDTTTVRVYFPKATRRK